MKINWPLIGAVAVNLTFSTIGDVFAKFWGLTNNQKWFYLGLPVNLITILAFVFIVRWGGLAIPTAIVLILTILINVTVGFFFFKEVVSTTQFVGIAFALIAIVLLLDIWKISLN